MKTDKTPTALKTLKLFLTLPVILIVLFVFYSCGRSNNMDAALSKIALPPAPPAPPKVSTMTGSDSIWQMNDEAPLLPGGDKLLSTYIGKNLRYPDAAKKQGIQGKVVVKFFISSKGDVNGHEIYKSVSPELDAEALRVVKSITKFEPARKSWKPVPSWYYVPISFVLK